MPASCRARVLHADGTRGLVLVGCQAQTPATLQLFGREAQPLLRPTPIGEGDLPDHDVGQHGRPRFLQITPGLSVDLDRKALVEKPSLGPDRAQATTDWDERRRGIYARRGDGAELGGPPESETSGGPPNGPLRWARPIKK